MVKRPSYLFFIPFLNILDGMIPDSMHCVYLGVVKQFSNLKVQLGASITLMLNGSAQFYLLSNHPQIFYA